MVKVLMDYGHGGSDPGAVYQGLIERDMNLVTGKACTAELQRHGVRVVETRSSNASNPSVAARADIANRENVALVVSLHHNAGGGDGAEVIHTITGGKGRALALTILEEINKQTGQNTRKAYSRESIKYPGKDYFTIIGRPKAPAVIVECAFLDSVDNLIVNTVAKQQAMGIAVAHGILKHLGIAVKGSAPAHKPTTPKSPGATTYFRVVTGSFQKRDEAEKRIKALKASGYDSFIAIHKQ